LNYGPFIKTISYSYDPEGNIESMNDPEGGVTNYEYDSLNRLIRITDPSLRVIDFTYDNIGRRSRIDYPNGAYNTYTYDNANRLKNLSIWNITDTLLSFYNYSYDKIGNKNRIYSTDGDFVYKYDDIYRLIGINKTYTDLSYKQINFTYDPAGNRLTKNVNGEITSYIYDNNRLISEISDRTINYSYDLNGNLIHKQDPLFGNASYLYDYENMLTSVILPDSATINYNYSSTGSRLRRSNTTHSSYYFYAFEDILMKFDAIGDVLERNTHSNIIDEPLTTEIGGNLYCYHSDKSLSIRLVTDSSSEISASYRYTAFGEIENQTGNFDSDYSYTGREKDNETGLYFYRTRYYNPSIGRFISEDAVGAISDINLYKYVGNNPINFIDPFGRGTILEQKLKKKIEQLENHIEFKKQKAKELTDQAKELYEKAKEELQKAEDVPGSSFSSEDAKNAMKSIDAALTVTDIITGAYATAAGIELGSTIFAATGPLAAAVAPVVAAATLVMDLIDIDVQNHLQAAQGAAATADGIMVHVQHYNDDIKDELKDLEEWSKILKFSRCGLGHTAANPIVTSIKNFRYLYEELVQKDRTFDTGFNLANAVKESCDATGRNMHL